MPALAPASDYIIHSFFFHEQSSRGVLQRYVPKNFAKRCRPKIFAKIANG